MAIRVLRYFTVDVDDRLRREARRFGERLRIGARSYLLSAADDVDTAGDRVRGLCDAAVHRVDAMVDRVSDKIDPTGTPDRDVAAHPSADPQRPVRLEAV